MRTPSPVRRNDHNQNKLLLSAASNCNQQTAARPHNAMLPPAALLDNLNAFTSPERNPYKFYDQRCVDYESDDIQNEPEGEEEDPY